MSNERFFEISAATIPTDLEEKVIKFAKEQLIFNVLMWEDYRIDVIDRMIKHKCNSFENWLDRNIVKSQLPDSMSFNDLIALVGYELEEIYATDTAKAIEAKRKKK